MIKLYGKGALMIHDGAGVFHANNGSIEIPDHLEDHAIKAGFTRMGPDAEESVIKETAENLNSGDPSLTSEPPALTGESGITLDGEGEPLAKIPMASDLRKLQEEEIQIPASDLTDAQRAKFAELVESGMGELEAIELALAEPSEASE